MKEIEICINEDAVSASLENAAVVAKKLSAILRELKALGANDVSVGDLEDIVKSEGHPPKIREVILNGKDLRVAGIAINPDHLQIPVEGIRNVSLMAKKVDPGGNYIMTWAHFEIENGAVVCAACCEKDYRRKHTTFGTIKSREIIEDTQAMCDLINAIGKKIGVNQYHPLRNPERLIRWNAGQQMFEPAADVITSHIK